MRRDDISIELAFIFHNDHKEDNSIQKQTGIDTIVYGKRERDKIHNIFDEIHRFSSNRVKHKRNHI